MLAYIVLLLAILSRILPAFHSAAWNFTALGGGLLFFGSRMHGGKAASPAPPLSGSLLPSPS